MANEAAYCCAAVIFVVLIVLFAVSFRANRSTRAYCQGNSKRYREFEANCRNNPSCSMYGGQEIQWSQSSRFNQFETSDGW